MFLNRVAGFIYKNEGYKLAKFLLKSADILDAFNVHGDYQIAEALFNCLWLRFASLTKWSQLRKALVNIIRYYKLPYWFLKYS